MVTHNNMQSALFNSFRTENLVIEELPSKFVEQMLIVTNFSEFSYKIVQQYPVIFWESWHSQQLAQSFSQEFLQQFITENCDETSDEERFMGQLRFARNVLLVQIIWRDLNQLTTTVSVLRDISLLADQLIKIATQFASCAFELKYGQCIAHDGKPIKLLILGLGKLGGWELNLSSDVDLLFCFREEGIIENNETMTTNDYFRRLSQSVIYLLNEITKDGFVYRVDTRLRPYGKVGRLAYSFNALESYYQREGRRWERYALIKTRQIVGEEDDGKWLIENIIKPFVYRKYTDFSTLSAIRKMHRDIKNQLTYEHLEGDIKSGYGGIREIEFSAQTIQLIYGGRHPALQHTNLLSVLAVIKNLRFLSDENVTTLKWSYLFFRRLENRLQAVSDQQIHRLPNDEILKFNLALSLGFDDWQNFHVKLRNYQHQVHQIFQNIVDKNVDESSDQQDFWEYFWQAKIYSDRVLELLTQHSKFDVDDLLTQIAQIKESQRYLKAPQVDRKRTDQFFVKVLNYISNKTNANELLKLIISLVNRVMKRTSYLLLLLENPQVFERLFDVFSLSKKLAKKIIDYPFLLDELLHENQRMDCSQDIYRMVDSNIQDNADMAMEYLIGYKQSYEFQLAVGKLINNLSVEYVGEHLSKLAEAMLIAVCNVTNQHMRGQYGCPINDKEDVDDQDIAIIGFGKLGSAELNFNSDLDLIFLYPSINDQLYTSGPKKIESYVYYRRLAQRIISMMAGNAYDGSLYQIDIRLRPNGKSGLLITNIDGFKKYQLENAWVWELQALVRARWIAGNETLKHEFEQIRYQILSQTRDEKIVREQVNQMRHKVIDSHVKNHLLDEIKWSQGGLIDIEFIVQYAVLVWAGQHPDLINERNTVAILTQLGEKKLLGEQDVKILLTAWQFYTNAIQLLAIKDNIATEQTSKIKQYFLLIDDIWQRIMQG